VDKDCYKKYVMRITVNLRMQYKKVMCQIDSYLGDTMLRSGRRNMLSSGPTS
jgi:hypothetical protein